MNKSKNTTLGIDRAWLSVFIATRLPAVQVDRGVVVRNERFNESQVRLPTVVGGPKKCNFIGLFGFECSRDFKVA